MEARLTEILQEKFQTGLEQATNEQVYYALLTLTKERIKEGPKNEGKRKLYYISAEFLIGKLLSNNLINLGIYDETAEVLKKHGKNLAEIEEVENYADAQEVEHIGEIEDSRSEFRVPGRKGNAEQYVRNPSDGNQVGKCIHQLDKQHGGKAANSSDHLILSQGRDEKPDGNHGKAQKQRT